jgi:hypothetical protein
MSLEQLSYLAQIVGSVGLIFSLVFVGLQIKHNTAALQRNEHNSTMAQWTVIRQAIATNRDIAELMYFSEGAFEATGGALLGTLLRTPGGESWWRKAKHIGFPPGFVLDVDAVLARETGAAK